MIMIIIIIIIIIIVIVIIIIIIIIIIDGKYSDAYHRHCITADEDPSGRKIYFLFQSLMFTIYMFL